MQELHQPPSAADEDEHIAVAHVRTHLLLLHSDQRVDSLAHVRASRTQVIAHRVVKAEHGPSCFVTLDAALSCSSSNSVFVIILEVAVGATLRSKITPRTL